MKLGERPAFFSAHVESFETYFLYLARISYVEYNKILFTEFVQSLLKYRIYDSGVLLYLVQWEKVGQW